MSESARTRGSAVEQLVFCEKRIEELEDENRRLRRALDTIKVRGWETGDMWAHDMALAALQEKDDG